MLQVRLTDASFVWTEPHSKRIKLKLTVQKEVLTGAVLQQIFVVEFIILNQVCLSCCCRGIVPYCHQPIQCI